jgi:hypothetical protein
MKAGVVQPRVLMEKVVPQFDEILTAKPEDSQFWGPIKAMPADFPQADKDRLTAAYRTLIADQLMPAIKKQRDFIANEYLPATRDTVGLDALPEGKAWYAFNAKESTTTAQTPEQIHAIGLAEVARIHAEINQVMAQVGFKGSLQDFFKFMQNDKQFEFKSEQALLEHYRGLEAKVNANVGKLFSLTPKAGFEIRPVEAFRAKSAAGGSYMTPSEDGTRPGIFYVNTYDLPTRKTWDAEDLFLHEAIPGHHFQLALQQELKDVPAFRRFGGETAFIEGWGLYAESLGKDLGAVLQDVAQVADVDRDHRHRERRGQHHSGRPRCRGLHRHRADQPGRNAALCGADDHYRRRAAHHRRAQRSGADRGSRRVDRRHRRRPQRPAHLHDRLGPRTRWCAADRRHRVGTAGPHHRHRWAAGRTARDRWGGLRGRRRGRRGHRRVDGPGHQPHRHRPAGVMPGRQPGRDAPVRR